MNINSIRTLLRQSKKGNKESFEKLLAENKKLSKRANQRMLRLERADKDIYAYQPAYYWLENTYDKLGKKRFPTSRKLFEGDLDLLYEQILEERKFLRAQTSTISGQKKYEENVKKSFERILGKEVEREKMWQVLQDGYFSELKKYIPSDAILDIVDRSLEAEKSIDEIKNVLDNYLSNNIDFNDIYSNLNIEFIVWRKDK